MSVSSTAIKNSNVNVTKSANKLNALSIGGGVDKDATAVKDGLSMLPVANVTQITSKATAVVAHGRSGVITTDDATVVNDTKVSFVVSNEYATASSIVLLSLLSVGNSAATSIPAVNVSARAAGSFTVTIANGGAAATGADSILQIGYVILSTDA